MSIMMARPKHAYILLSTCALLLCTFLLASCGQANGTSSKQQSSSGKINTANFLVEPQFLFRIGGDRMKFNVKVGFNWLSDIFGSDSYSGPFTADLFTISTGFTFSL
jgi:hypothetical protein